MNIFQVAPVAADTLNFVKETVAEAAKVSQEAVADAAKTTKEYAAAGAHKTQEVYNEYVRQAKLHSILIELLEYFSGCTCCC